MAARLGDPGRWMAGAIRCVSACTKGEQAPQTPLERMSRCASGRGSVRVEPQEIGLPIKDETVDAETLIPRERVEKWTADPIGDVLPISRRDSRCGDADPARTNATANLPEQIEDVPQFRDKTVDAVILVPSDRVQRRTPEQNEDGPQSPDKTLEAVTWVPA